ncbi:MAG: NADPH:quinone reductase-like Zn-dependent oxidoreductase [Hyphomicrobiaceae bacterium]|jgi:NADPH:quinone reductase-like Zn-dependent oxidoreductase
MSKTIEPIKLMPFEGKIIMKAMMLRATTGPEALEQVQLPEPEPKPNEVLVRMRASSLNWRDSLIFKGGYRKQQKTENLIPLTDGAGEIVDVGADVDTWKVGDRVIANFCPNWIAGEPRRKDLESAAGKSVDGMLCELKTFAPQALVRTPDHLTDIEAGSLPCAAQTAWNALIVLGRIQPGDIVLTQGTGGVSLFALQFAKMAGAQVIITSSSDDKLARAKAMGADHLINYVANPDWGRAAVEISGGRGVDHVIELGGTQTLKQSLMAVRPGGTVSMIGVLSGANFGDLLLPFVVSRQVRLQGVTVGSRQMLETLCQALAVHSIKPVIDSVYKMEQTAEALAHLNSGKHFGKVCIEI